MDIPEVELLKRVADVREMDGPEFNIDALLERGWFYQDFPKMLPEYWAYIKAGMGEQGVDFHLITEANYGGRSMRGQMICSPQCRENLRLYREANPLPTESSP